MTFLNENALHLGPLRVLRGSREDLAARLKAALEPDGAPVAIAFCNAHTAEIAFENPDYSAALRQFVVVNDGVGMEIAARILEGRGFPQNLNGTDFFPWYFARLEAPLKVYLLGAKPGVAEEAGRRFSLAFPNVEIVGARDGFFPMQDEPAIVAEIAAARPDMVLVALGNPKQEMFIARNIGRLGVRAMCGVGALFDFTAGQVVRAPGWVRRIRLEWAYRLSREPGRLMRRYTVETASFLFAVLKFRVSAERRNSP